MWHTFRLKWIFEGIFGLLFVGKKPLKCWHFLQVWLWLMDVGKMHRTQLFAVFTLGKMPLQMLFSTVVENHRKSLIQQYFTLTFWVDKSLSKMPKIVNLATFCNLKLAVKQCYQTGQIDRTQNEKVKWDNFGDF